MSVEMIQPILSEKEFVITEVVSSKILGFWLYLMSDCVVFATLFVAFAVLSPHTAGGAKGSEIFNLRYVLIQTFCLLSSTFTCGLSMIARNKGNHQVIFWLSITVLLGGVFLGLEMTEFSILIMEGSGPGRSAFLSAFFSLVGTHGLHVTVGLLWMMIMIYQIFKKGLTQNTQLRLFLLSLFWHFLDIIWIFVFSIVYLMGSLP